MNDAFGRIDLEDLGAVSIAGAEAVRFLQGQLSNDMARLGPERSLLAGYHNPQGRALALLRLVWLADGELLALLPRELAVPVAQRLSKYVLRAKVSVTDASQAWRVSGLAEHAQLEAGEPASLARADLPPPRAGAQRSHDRRILLALGGPGERWLEIVPREADGSMNPAARERWRLLEVRAGVPQVYAATSEQFVAQMLNLDVLEAIDFDKGCYTGQEVIARAHYRGRVKRRMQRMRSMQPLELAPGASGHLPDGRGFNVVESARLPDGRCEFLAVAALPGTLSGSRVEANVATVLVEPLDLPYALPE